MRASSLWPETALRTARLRLLSRIMHGPVVLIALLPTPAASDWQRMLKEDIADLRATLSYQLQELPPPLLDPAPWLDLIFK